MTYQVRADPDQSPAVAFSPTESRALERLVAAQKAAQQVGHPFTLRDAVQAMATKLAQDWLLYECLGCVEDCQRREIMGGSAIPIKMAIGWLSANVREFGGKCA